MFAVRRKAEVKETLEATYTPSLFVRTHFRIPDKETGQMRPFSFKGQPYYRDIYDAQYEALLLMSARQVGKSTLVGNMCLIAATTRERHAALYVSPTEVQTSEFSKTRLRTVVEDSPYLREFLNRKHDAETYKRFLFTESIIRLRYAYHNADRCRGLTTDDLIIDEIQDILADNIPVIEQAQFTSKRKRRLYSGTPKSEENTLSHYWYNYSTQGEWVVPCYRHSFIEWNLIGEDNVPERHTDGLVCAKCKKSINPADEMAHWVHANPEPKVEIPFLGFRIPQIITPFVDWREVIDAKKTYPRSKFLNEKLGLPSAGGVRPISREQLKSACDETTATGDAPKARNRTWFLERRALHSFAGIDWGTGENASFTYIVVGGYYGGDDLRVSFYHRLIGEELEPVRQVSVVQEIIESYGCQRVVADYGGGHDRNDQLMRLLGVKRFFRLQYLKLNAMLKWDFDLGRFLGRRTELMTMVFEAIKRKQIILPNWEEVEGTLAKEIMACTSEVTSRGDTIYNRAPNNPDDGMHALVYMTVASTLSVPRPDFVIPVVKPALDTSIAVGREWSEMPSGGPTLKHDNFGF